MKQLFRLIYQSLLIVAITWLVIKGGYTDAIIVLCAWYIASVIRENAEAGKWDE